MSRYFTEEDANECIGLKKESVMREKVRIESGLEARSLVSRTSSISLKCRSMSLSYVTLGDFRNAVTYAHASVAYRCMVYEVFGDAGETYDYASAGDFRTLLMAYVTGDYELVGRFADLFEVSLNATDVSSEDAIYIAKVLYALALNDIPAAREQLSEARPGISPEFRGYYECLDAIARQDASGLAAAVEYAAGRWERWVSRNERHFPEAACFMDGVGLLKLGEKVTGSLPEVDAVNIPPELLGDIQYERLDLLPDWENILARSLKITQELAAKEAEKAGKKWWRFWR